MSSILFILGCGDAATPFSLKPEVPEVVEPLNVADGSLTRWGQRSSACQQPKDWWELKAPFSLKDIPQFTPEEKNQNNAPIQLSSNATASNCYRVGGEIKIWQPGPEPRRLLARALVTKVVQKAGQSKVVYDILETFPSLSISEEGKRIPNCDARFYDRRNFKVYGEQAVTLLEGIVEGRVTANIWNGTRNCFRVGSLVKVLSDDEENRDKDHGSLLIKRVEMIHISELTGSLIEKTGLSEEILRTQLGEKLDRYYGFLSVVHFEYQAD